MIVKKVKNQNKTKPKAWQIGDLVDYIRHPHDRNPLEKIEHSGGRNFFAETHAGQKMEMIALAGESIHSNMPVTHWIFSWPENEQPTAKQIEEVVDIFLERMGLDGHQTVYGLHYNTENYHLHIAVNRMNPESVKVVQPHNGFDIEEAHKIVAVVEHKQQWQSEKKARYSVAENGNIVRNTYPAVAKPKQEALDFERVTGEKSAQRIAQERGYDLIKNAPTWKNLHQELAKIGLRFEKKGSGAVIFVGDIAVKASSVNRAFSMKTLCKKLGDFEPGEYTLVPEKIAPEPVSSVNLDEWKKYRAERAEASAQAVENDPVREIKKRHRAERNAMFSRLAKRGFAFLTLAHYHLCKRQAIALRHPAKVKSSVKRRSVPLFETWLRKHGLDRLADRWRYKDRLETLPQKSISPVPPTHPFVLSVAKSTEAYAAHREAILKKDAGQEPSRQNPSRIDAMIALRMRSIGNSRESVIEAMLQCAPKAHDAPDSRNWERYSKRIAGYAFGIAGDVELARSASFAETSFRIEGIKETRPDEQQQENPHMRMR